MDRRQGRQPVSAVQFWLGIAVSLVALVGVAVKVGQWTGRVDMSVQQLTSSVSEFRDAMKATVADNKQMQLDIQRNSLKLEELEKRASSRQTPVFGPGRMFDK